MAKRAKKAAKAKKTAKSKKPKGSWKKDARVLAIIAECKTAVMKGVGSKTFDSRAEQALNSFFGLKIQRRKDQRDDWDKALPSGGYVKDKPLMVANHLGQICAILSDGAVVNRVVALAAAKAVQKDQTCTTALGRGDWCA
jgi:hypothetical protein